MSPSGRYILYFEDITDTKNPTELKTIGRIIELVQDPKTKEFKFEEKRTINDFYERYARRANKFNGYDVFYYQSDFYLTDSMEVLYFNNKN